ncbi:hypothetical protein JYQ62_23035 [Nostoc sp. UHCC 0702]|nr:hypothetical protein JYQ62_23035 [Nostoc sp. UHCC 0702]
MDFAESLMVSLRHQTLCVITIRLNRATLCDRTDTIFTQLYKKLSLLREAA